MNKSIKYILILAVFAGTVMSCSKEDGVEGPELQDIFGEFEILEPLETNVTEVDFAAGQTVELNASISIRTPWKIEIYSLNTSAKKVIEGNEREIMGGVAEWNGSITFAPLFQSNEQVAVRMSFENFPDTMYTDTITILEAKPIDNISLLISDFEDPGQGYNPFAEVGGTNQQRSGLYNQSDFSIPPNFIEIVPAEGNSYWHVAANNINSVFISGFSLSAENIGGSTHLQFGTAQPSKIHFNAFIFGYGNQNTEVAIGFQEDDNQDGTYDRFTEGEYLYNILVDWQGWKLVSFSLDETLISTSGGFGNIDATGQKDMDRIINIEFLNLARQGTTGLTGYCLDFANFTELRAWEP